MTGEFVGAVADQLAVTQPAMAVFSAWAEEWRRYLRGAPPKLTVHRLRGWVRRRQAQLREEPIRIRRVVARSMPVRARVLTISSSSTVTASILSLRGAHRPQEVIALESRPGGEGRSLVRALRQGGVSARWAPDRRMKDVVRAVDLVVVGADTVERNGDVIHKVGTRALARQAHRVGVDFVVITGRSKSRTGPAPRRQLPPRFDRTPARWVTEYWSDRGALRKWTSGRDGAASQRP